MWRSLLVLSQLLLMAASTHGQTEECTSPSIMYTPRTFRFDAPVGLTCTLPSSSPLQWWRSTDPCGPFSELSACVGSNCEFMVNESIGRYFYYCCTEQGTSPVTGRAPRECFHLQICTKITSTPGASAPAVAFFGHLVDVYVSMYAEPPPSPVTPILHLDHSNQSQLFESASVPQGELVTLTSDSPLLVWVYSVHVMDVSDEVTRADLMFSVAYGTANEASCPSTQHIGYTIPVVRRGGGMPTTSGSTTRDSTSETPEPLSVVDCITQTIVAVALSLLLSSFLLASLIANCVLGGIWYYRYRKKSRPARPTRIQYRNTGYNRVNSSGSTPGTNPNTPMTVLATIDEVVEEIPTGPELEGVAPHTPATPHLPLPPEPYATAEEQESQQPTLHTYDTASAVMARHRNVTPLQQTQNGNGTPLPAQNGNEPPQNGTPIPAQNENGTLLPAQNVSEPPQNGNGIVSRSVANVDPYRLSNTPSLDVVMDSNITNV